MATEYQRELARKKARERGKIPASEKKKPKRIKVSPKEQEQIDIDKYQTRYQKGKKDKPSKPLGTLKDYGKKDSTAVSGGSKAVRKVTADDSGDTDLVKRLRKKPFQYYFTSPNPRKKTKKNR